MNDQEQEIYDLLERKSFDDLTEVEKELVIKELGSREEYEQIRMTMAMVDDDSSETPPPSDLKTSLLDAFDQEHGGRRRQIEWWKYAAVLALMISATWLFWPEGITEGEPIAEKTERKQEKSEKEEAENRVETKEDDQKPIEEEPTDDQKDETMTEAEVKSANELSEAEPTDEEESAVPEDLIHADAEMEAEVESDDEFAVSNYNNEREEAFQGEESKAASRSLSKSSPVSTALSFANSGVTLNSLGGPFKDAYIAY